MKHIFRKPLIPGVLFLLLAFGVCFLILFQQNILDDQRSVDEMYSSVQLTFQVLPGADGVLRLKSRTARELMSIEGVSRCFYHFECRYSVREPLRLANLSTIYGVNDISFFAGERDLRITYGDGWDEQAVLNPAQDAPVPCILEANLAIILGVEPGDTFVIASNADQNVDLASNPSVTMVAAGTFTDGGGLTDLYGMIVCDRTFVSRPGRFLHNDLMANLAYFYRSFYFQVEPSRNRDFQRIREEANSVLKGAGSFSLYSNARILEQTVRPIEQKIHIQQMLVTPLSILLCIASAVVAVLLCTGFSTEVFLRLFWGEKRPVVWLSMTGSLVVLMAAEGAMALLAVWLVSGTGWIAWAARYLLLTVCLCAAAAAVQQAVFCGRNLVAFYQSKEE